MAAGLKQIRERSRALQAMADNGEYGKSVILSIDLLVDDPDNKEIYGEYETDGLAESMSENGFRGRIYVYPVDGGKYMIESGHRSKEAAIKAGKKSVPVIVTEPPKDDVERRKRLVLANLHGRRYNPMMFARQAEYLYDTYKAEYEAKKKAGDESADPKILDRVASDLEVSTAELSRYRLLTGLIPELQTLVEGEKYSWVALGPAARLKESQQQMLYKRIMGESRLRGPEGVTGAWIAKEIEEYKYIKGEGSTYSFDPSNIMEGLPEAEKKEPAADAEKEPAPRGRRVDGTKAILKARDSVRIALSPDALIKTRDLVKARTALTELRDMINEYLGDKGE